MVIVLRTANSPSRVRPAVTNEPMPLPAGADSMRAVRFRGGIDVVRSGGGRRRHRDSARIEDSAGRRNAAGENALRMAVATAYSGNRRPPHHQPARSVRGHRWLAVAGGVAEARYSMPLEATAACDWSYAAGPTRGRIRYRQPTAGEERGSEG